MPRSQLNIGAQSQLVQVMGYAAALELEVDRLRRRDQFLQLQAQDFIRRISHSCKDAEHSPDSLSSLTGTVIHDCNEFAGLLRDLYEPAGYHPSFDQVIAIAVRPLAEQIFRWQQRLCGASDAVLRLDLQPDAIDWFPARLRHILDNLMSNALRYRDPQKGEIRVGLQLRTVADGYELRFTDNGLGIPEDQAAGLLELFYRAAPSRAAGLGVGLAVVKLLVEQCCGTIAVSSGRGQGTSITVVLPRYHMDDFVD
jgi:signal transduction histidine kinase